MRSLVVGQGSIGRRHARLLRDMGHEVAVLSRQPLEGTVYTDLAAALTAERHDYVVIANDTAQHADALRELVAQGFTGSVLVEKPLSDRRLDIPQHRFRAAGVAYNLRFHPVIRRLREIVASEQVLSVDIYVGQYLPDWRPTQNHLETYSAWRERGGGVLRDLSHEIDYATWIFGPWARLAAVSGRVGSITVDSDDQCAIIAELAAGGVLKLTMNYFDRIVRREIIVNCTGFTVHADVVAGTVRMNADMERLTLDADAIYRRQHETLLGDDHADLCSLETGARIVDIIDAVEQASAARAWVTLQ